MTPKVIFEVQSPLTERYDRNDKFNFYAQIETLTDYILIETERTSIEHFQRVEEGWLRRSYGHREEFLFLKELKISLALAEIYEDSELPDRDDAPQIAPRSEV